jgi:hypothetical protein
MATISDLYRLLKQVMGGANNIQTVKDDLDAELDLAQDTLIGTAGLLLTAAEQTIYDRNNAGIPFIFNGGYIDLSPLAANDIVIIRTTVTSGDGVNLRQVSIDLVNTYTGVVTPPMIVIPELPPTSYEIKITIQQTAAPVSYKTIFPHLYDSVRGS